MTPSQYKKFKSLKRENLRDHMTDLELIFSMLGEASTTEIAKNKNAQGFTQNKTASQQGGDVAGNARKDLERKSGKRVSTKQNYLPRSPRCEAGQQAGLTQPQSQKIYKGLNYNLTHQNSMCDRNLSTYLIYYCQRKSIYIYLWQNKTIK